MCGVSFSLRREQLVGWVELVSYATFTILHRQLEKEQCFDRMNEQLVQMGMNCVNVKHNLVDAEDQFWL